MDISTKYLDFLNKNGIFPDAIIRQKNTGKIFFYDRPTIDGSISQCWAIDDYVKESLGILEDTPYNTVKSRNLKNRSEYDRLIEGITDCLTCPQVKKIKPEFYILESIL